MTGRGGAPPDGASGGGAPGPRRTPVVDTSGAAGSGSGNDSGSDSGWLGPGHAPYSSVSSADSGSTLYLGSMGTLDTDMGSEARGHQLYSPLGALGPLLPRRRLAHSSGVAVTRGAGAGSPGRSPGARAGGGSGGTGWRDPGTTSLRNASPSVRAVLEAPLTVADVDWTSSRFDEIFGGSASSGGGGVTKRRAPVRGRGGGGGSGAAAGAAGLAGGSSWGGESSVTATVSAGPSLQPQPYRPAVPDYSHIGPRVDLSRGLLVHRSPPIVVPPKVALSSDDHNPAVAEEGGWTPRFNLQKPRKAKHAFKLSGTRERAASLPGKLSPAASLHKRPRRVRTADPRLRGGPPEPEHLRTKRLRNNVAAVHMQRIARGFLVRLHMTTMREASRVLQRWWRKFFAVKLRAVLLIQRGLHQRPKLSRAIAVIKRMGMRWAYKRHRRARIVGDAKRAPGRAPPRALGWCCCCCCRCCAVAAALSLLVPAATLPPAAPRVVPSTLTLVHVCVAGCVCVSCGCVCGVHTLVATPDPNLRPSMADAAAHARTPHRTDVPVPRRRVRG